MDQDRIEVRLSNVVSENKSGGGGRVYCVFSPLNDGSRHKSITEIHLKICNRDRETLEVLKR